MIINSLKFLQKHQIIAAKNVVSLNTNIYFKITCSAQRSVWCVCVCVRVHILIQSAFKCVARETFGAVFKFPLICRKVSLVHSVTFLVNYILNALKVVGLVCTFTTVTGSWGA